MTYELLKTCCIIFLSAMLLLLGVKETNRILPSETELTAPAPTATDTISIIDSATVSLFKQQIKATRRERDSLKCVVISLQGKVSDTVKYKSWSDKENLITKE